MSDPQTSNVGLYQPTRGSDPGTWDSPVNANTGAADSLAANVAIIPLTSGNVNLTTPPNSGASWSGPYQSQSGILRFTGTLTGNVTVTLPRAGFFIVENLCVVGVGHSVELISVAPGEIISAPPGEAVHIYCDGVNVRYVNLGRIGSYLDLATATIPQWIINCTVPPYLNCDGSTFSAVTYPQLAALLGGTTLPDLRGRSRAALNQGTGRISTAGSGVDGDTLLSGGGAQNQTLVKANLPNISLVGTVTDPGHAHAVRFDAAGVAAGSASFPLVTVNPSGASGGQATVAATTGISVTTPLGSSAPLTTLPPTAIGGLTLIRAG